MKYIIRMLFTVALVSYSIFTSNAQIGINSDGASPDASAMLEITSNDKGILIPRMTTNQRENINSPATGLLVYDNEEGAFWYYNGTAWNKIGNSVFTSEDGITYSNNNNDFVFGADSLNYGTGTESKFFFDKSKGAFRAGIIDGTEWNKDNIGSYSAAFGENNDVNDDYSFAAGEGHIISNTHSSTFGYYNEISGDGSFAAGEYNIITSRFSSAFGGDNDLTGNYSFASGLHNDVSGKYATALGLRVEAPSYAEVAIGSYNTTYTANGATIFDTADRLFTIGNGTSTSNRSNALVVYKSGNTEINGNLTVFGSITGTNSPFISENGITYSNNNNNDFVFGADSLNYGSGTENKFFFDKSKGAFRAGIIDNTNWDESNLGNNSIGLGYNVEASGLHSTAIGYYSEATGILGIAMGSNAEAAGESTIALGDNPTADGNSSVAIGYNVTAASFGEIALGTYNTDYTPNSTNSINTSDRLLVIGNGTNNQTKSDALIIYKSGNTEINGNVGINRNPQTNELEVEGNASKSSAGDWLANSDARLKKNIEPLHAQTTLERLLNLQGVTYEWNDSTTGTKRPEGIQYGFTAQNIQTVFPNLVEEDAKGYLQTAYGTYDAMYVEALRALNDENIYLKNRVEGLESQVAKINQLERTLQQLQTQLNNQ